MFYKITNYDRYILSEEESKYEEKKILWKNIYYYNFNM